MLFGALSRGSLRGFHPGGPLRGLGPDPTRDPPQKTDRDPPWDQAGGRRQQRPVPVSRISRAAAMGGLALELGLGALAGAAQKRLQGQEQRTGSPPLLSEATAERLVATLSRARGAALKLGQLLSMAGGAGAGAGPRLAAATPGVPGGSRGCRLPGAGAPGTAARRPRGGAQSAGLFAVPSLRALQRELELECDYGREAASARRFRSLLGGDPFFRVPRVLPQLSSRRVLCTEWGRGAALERCRRLGQERRDQICSELLRLCLLELFQFRFMQTDPNWANFLYEPESNTVTLLDFGACREFEREFTDLYIEVIRAAAERDKEKILRRSEELKFLTGFESPALRSLHVQAVLLLGEPFWGPQPFDFGAQGTAQGVGRLLPQMLRGRLGPPPEPSYALHRKLGGLFLACARLGGRVRCRELFQQVYEGYWDPKNREETPKTTGSTPEMEPDSGVEPPPQ
ncbi:atypical kinase COQ8B, mitochondrial-like isoform X2 [Oenanthe melanoleuca]|uniref:atypical kinase COQ8B, mitochondrial-like isoform X2 n=1 Tax=Oenanthe melanoleuca TaxID=2939378 RepID=UPI0024C1FB5E|nr:atypical kinase COQ8B, mitochondrial-like isoform X2 [Oenanthe melanoleuca]